MSDLDKTALRKLAEEASPSPWKCERSWNNGGMPLSDFTIPGHNGEATVEMLSVDAVFIVHARTAVPELLDQLDAAEAECEHLRLALCIQNKRVDRQRLSLSARLQQLSACQSALAEACDLAEALREVVDHVDAYDDPSLGPYEEVNIKNHIKAIRTKGGGK